MPRISFHRDLICRGRCPVSKPSFQNAVKTLLKSVVGQVISEVGNSEAELFLWSEPVENFLQTTTDDGAFRPGHVHPDFEVSDQLLEIAFWLRPLSGPKEKETIMRSLVVRFLALYNKKSECFSFDPCVFALLWWAVVAKDTETVSTVLKKTRHLLPSCVLSSLLLKSIELDVTQCVSALLLYGAAPDVGLVSVKSDMFYPLRYCIYRFYQTIKNVPETGWRLVDPEQFGNAVANLSSIVGHCRLLDSEEENTPVGVDGVQFGNLENISELVNFLNESRYLYSGAEMEFEKLFPVLSESCVTLNIQSQFSLDSLAIIVKFGMLPLLRSGSRFTVLRTMTSSTAFVRFAAGIVEPSIADHWRRFFIQLFRECFGNISISANVAENLAIPDPTYLQSTIFLRHPNNLQTFARRAILNCLKTGLLARRASIAKLPLPRVLMDFLDFKEFDIFH